MGTFRWLDRLSALAHPAVSFHPHDHSLKIKDYRLSPVPKATLAGDSQP